MNTAGRLLDGREPCLLVKNFVARQGVILIAGLVFLGWTASRLVKSGSWQQPTGLTESLRRLNSPQSAAEAPQEAPCRAPERPHNRVASVFDLQAVRVKLRYERRNLKTFCADCSKQAGQQMIGGVLMVGLGLMLARESGLDALAWYGAQYPFEIVLTTVFTGDAAWSNAPL